MAALTLHNHSLMNSLGFTRITRSGVSFPKIIPIIDQMGGVL